MEYAVLEANMERLEKKLLRIRNKCDKYGCDFHYQVTGETFREVEDEHGQKTMARFLLVEADGTAVMNGWEFVASVEHTENGNVFSGVRGIEVPERYYQAKPVCEHCNTNRYRKYTYIVRNRETDEFKQVGKACLNDFTHGLSAEAVTHYLSLFDTLVRGEAPMPGCGVESYLPKEEYLRYVAETMRHFGYVSRSMEMESNAQGTASRAYDYYEADNGHAVSLHYLEKLRREMDSVGFDVNRPETVAQVRDALDWIASQPEENSYVHNLKTVCGLEYVAVKNYALLASLMQTYSREMKQQNRRRAQNEAGSRHVGTVGEKITVHARTIRCMTTYNTQYGPQHIYKITDNDGNVLIWKTGVTIVGNTDGAVVTGTVKDHSEFRGIKQTELTRCYITQREK